MTDDIPNKNPNTNLYDDELQYPKTVSPVYHAFKQGYDLARYPIQESRF